jgi:hypothetical protein
MKMTKEMGCVIRALNMLALPDRRGPAVALAAEFKLEFGEKFDATSFFAHVYLGNDSVAWTLYEKARGAKS